MKDKIVLDANVIVSAAFGGIPLDAVRKAFAEGMVFISSETFREIEHTIDRLSPKIGPEKSARLRTLWGALSRHFRTVEVVRQVKACRDPKDDAYLSLCLAASARFLVTGDRDLLEIDRASLPKGLNSLKIVSPREFVDRVGAE